MIFSGLDRVHRSGDRGGQLMRIAVELRSDDSREGSIIIGEVKELRGSRDLDRVELVDARLKVVAVHLAHAVDHFGTAATGTMYASMPSSSGSSGFSGGFSGGGGGGGGGGRW